MRFLRAQRATVRRSHRRTVAFWSVLDQLRRHDRRTEIPPTMEPMSYLLYDALLPHLGDEGAKHWATLLVVNPVW